MYYEINISKDGSHYFATAERSITDRRKLKEVYNKLKKSFPNEEGYEILVSRYEKIGMGINPEDI